MFQYDYSDTYCFECLIRMCFVFLYLHLLSAVEHVSHGKALQKFAHYYLCPYSTINDNSRISDLALYKI